MIAPNEHRILWLPEDEARAWEDAYPDRVGSRGGPRITPDNAHTVADVFACIRIRAETVASLPLHVYERTAKGGKRIARELPLYRQLHTQPNGWQTSYEWREQLIYHLDLWGDGFSELSPGKIEPLHPSRMEKVERLETGRLLYHYRGDDGVATPIVQDKILHLRGPSDDGITGWQIPQECSAAIELAKGCEIHGVRFFTAGARPGFVLTTDGQLNAEARESLRTTWNRKHGGVYNAHETGVLSGGLKPVAIPQSSNTDAQFLEQRLYQLKQIARLYRVPGYLLGLESGTAQAEIEFVTHTMIPLLRRLEMAMMRDLLGGDERYVIEFDVRGLLRGDASSRASYNRAMWDIGVVSTNDIRASENLDPVEGGDERYRPLNMGTLGAPASPQDVAAQQQKGSGIDGQGVEGGMAAATAAAAGGAEPPADPAAGSGEPQVADVSLNGAQINGLIAILSQVPAGLITKQGAAALIAASFPSITPEQVDAILAGVNETPPPGAEPPPGAAPPPPAAPGPPGKKPPAQASQRALTISIDFDRTFSADPALWGEFARKAVDDGNTVVMVSRRPDTADNRQTVTETLGDYAEAFSEVLLVGSDSLKDAAAKKAGVRVDVWVDDSPQTVRSIEGRECGANAEGGGGFQPGNKCAGGGGGGGGGGGKKSGGGGKKSGGPAHAEGSKAHKEREKHREARKASDYPEVRPDANHTAIRHTVAEPKYDENGEYIPPTRPEEWTPERQAMHREILEDATADVPSSEEPTLYMMGGGPAAGKSSLIKNGKVKHPENHVLSNPDELKLDIPDYRDSIAAGDPRSARVAHEESSYLNKQLMQTAAKKRQDVVWDGTGDNSIEKLEAQVRALKDKGYKVQADYVTCDTETAVARSNARGEKTGRFVPEEAVRATHARVSEIWPEAVARGLFDRSDLYDTTSGGEPVLVASARGTNIEVKDQAAYQRFLDKAKRR